MSKLRPLVHPIKDPEGRRAWAAQHTFCWACGVSEKKSWRVRFPGGLQTHHIVKPCRSDEPCDYARLCSLCHDLAEGIRVPKKTGGHYKNLSMADVLALKQKYDPANWNPERLMALWGRDCLPGEEDE